MGRAVNASPLPLCADSREDVRKVCPQCPLLTPVNNTKVVHAANAALAAFNAQNNGSHFELLEISRAQLVVKTEKPGARVGGGSGTCGEGGVREEQGSQSMLVSVVRTPKSSGAPQGLPQMGTAPFLGVAKGPAFGVQTADFRPPHSHHPAPPHRSSLQLHSPACAAYTDWQRATGS